MPDTIVAPPPAPASAPTAPAQPPAPPAAPAPARKGYDVPPDVTEKATEALGDFHMVQPPPVLDDEQVSGAQPPPPLDAPKGPQPGEAASPAAAETGKPQQTPLPGEEYLTELQKAGLLAEEKPAQPAQAQPLPTSDEEIAKAINPDGKATVEQQLKNAQSFIGKQGRELGQKVKTYEQQIATLTQGATEFVKHFTRDPNVPGGLRATANTVLGFFDTVPQPEMEAAILARGYKLVPATAELKSGEDPAERQWMETYVNKVKPGADQTYEEKLAEIRGDADLNERRLSDFNAWKLARVAQTQQYNNQQQHQLAVQRQQAEQLVDGFWASVSKDSDYAAVLKPAMLKLNQELGPYEDKYGRPLPGAIPLPVRLRVLRMAGAIAQFPNKMRKAVTDALERGRTEAATLREGVGAIPGAGESPDVSARNTGQPGQGKNGQTYTPEEMAGARKSFGLGYVATP